MPRANSSVVRKQRHKKWIKRAKGFRGRRSTTFKLAKEAVLKAGQHAYFDRRKKKANARANWHIIINAGARTLGTTYSKLTHALRSKHIEIDRKILATLAKKDPEIFKAVIEQATQK